MNSVIRDLLDEVVENCNSNENWRRKKIWINHNNQIGEKKLLFNVHLWKIIDQKVWYELIPISELKTKDKYERFVELQLRRKLFKFRYINDYDVIMPTIWTTPIVENTGPLFGIEPKVKIPKGSNEKNLFNSSMLLELMGDIQNIEGARKFTTTINDFEELKFLKKPKIIINKERTEKKAKKIKEIVNDLIPIKVIRPQLNTSPFEYVVQFRGIEKILFDFIDRPKLVHAMMRFFTECIVEQYKKYDKEGVFDPEYTWDFRVHFDRIENKERINSLKNCWAYISAQSASGISPQMYEEFLQPYHEKIGKLFGKVYYHGCEDLTEKFDIIKKLPNLRRFHISPWSNIKKILDKHQKQFIYEIAVHTTNHLFVFNNKQIAEDLKKIKKIIIEEDVRADINISDIETVNNNPKKLIEWAKIAKTILEV